MAQRVGTLDRVPARAFAVLDMEVDPRRRTEREDTCMCIGVFDLQLQCENPSFIY